jgi:hypothetical protein
MPISAHLLERAYQLIDANQLQNAELVLDAVVRVDPKNVTAWKAYLQIYKDHENLEWLMERILKNKELSDRDKADIRAYQDYLIQGLDNWKQNGEANPRRMINYESEQILPVQDDAVIFELLDEFDYPARKIERARRKRSRQIFKYNIPTYIWQGAALLAIFYIGVRLLVLGYLFGYLMIGAFIVGGVLWLRNINDHKIIARINVTHAYSLESENELYIIDKPIMDPKLDKNNKHSSPRIRYLDE